MRCKYMTIMCMVMMSVLCTGCVTYKTPADYSHQRASSPSAEQNFSSKNNLLDSPDGSVYHNRTMHIFGSTY